MKGTTIVLLVPFMREKGKQTSVTKISNKLRKHLFINKIANYKFFK